jgi:hypothetical protein
MFTFFETVIYSFIDFVFPFFFLSFETNSEYTHSINSIGFPTLLQ